MARQHVHNRRAGRGGGGSSWISYSDIMAALVLVFVLFLVFNLYQYNLMMEQKTAQLASQQTELDEQRQIIIIQQGELDEARIELGEKQQELDDKQAELDAQTIILIGKQEELDEAQAQLALSQQALEDATALLNAQREAFDRQSARLDALVGIRMQIVEELSDTLAAHNISASVDPKTGDIVLESTVFFNTNSYEIKPEGQAMLNVFVPLYLDVLLRPEYSGYLGEIIIEGHTDSSGGYIKNLQLSQNRALSVVEYCLSLPGLTAEQRALLPSILTAKGRSSADLIYNPDGTENADASRRVEFKFSLRDADMIDEMRQILSADSAEELAPFTQDEAVSE